MRRRRPAGTGAPANSKAEGVASKLGMEIQVAFLDMIYRLTVPGGLKPFLVRLESYMGVLEASLPKDAVRGGGRSGKKRASKSRKVSKG